MHVVPVRIDNVGPYKVDQRIDIQMTGFDYFGEDKTL
jgi:hypothetical protein